MTEFQSATRDQRKAALLWAIQQVNHHMYDTGWRNRKLSQAAAELAVKHYRVHLNALNELLRTENSLPPED